MELYTLASGSTGNCTLIIDRDTAVLIDIGISARRVCAALDSLGLAPEELSGILITHEHGDHICGLDTFIKHFDVPIFAPRTVANHLRWSVAGVEDFISELTVGVQSAVGSLGVTPFHTPHDTPESVGYRVSGSRILGFCTDCGFVSDEISDALSGVDCAVIEANHDLKMLLDGAYPAHLKRRILSDSGHLSNGDCGVLASALAQGGTKNLVLAHLSRENNTPKLALETVERALREQGVRVGKDVYIGVAPERDIYALNLEAASKC